MTRAIAVRPTIAVTLNYREAPDACRLLKRPHRHIQSGSLGSPSRASLSSKERVPPKAKVPLNTCSIIVSVTKLLPVPALTIESMSSGSIPALAPMTYPSQAVTRFAARSRLFTSFITWAWPGRSPITKTVLPMRSCQGFTAATASGAPAASSVRFPAWALAGPPVTGELTAGDVACCQKFGDAFDGLYRLCVVDADAALADLHYCDVADYAVGCNTSAGWTPDADGVVRAAYTDFLPVAEVERIEPNGKKSPM